VLQPISVEMTETQRLPLVLVADDDGVTRAMVTAWLSSSGFDVEAACDGDEALELAAQRQPDLLLVDVTMPGRDGYDVCRVIQEASAVPPPVIFLTAHTATTARVAGLDAGAVDYIVKPFERAELVARVRAALRTKARSDRLAERATRDGLTGLFNRAELDAHADAAVRLAERHGRPLACLMTDLDHFKGINDTLGHAAGDEVLKEVARRIVASCRESDVAGRYGGEEFLLLLPETPAADAFTTAEKLRRVLSEQPVAAGEHEIAVTTSVGVAVLQAGMDVAALYEAADQALYQAKKLGRNRTELYWPDPGSGLASGDQ
jgi:two-component system cell cycle response regulator